MLKEIGCKKKQPHTMDGTVQRNLINVARGEEKADLVIVNGNVLCVYTGELLKGYSVSIKGEKIAYLGSKADHTIGPETEIINAQGKVLIPGLIEGHTHLCWLYTIEEFLKHSITGGITTIITETMEAFPIMGYKGVLDILKSAQNQPIKIFATAPSMVSISHMAQAQGPHREIIQNLLARDDILGLGETYWQALFHDTDRILSLFNETLRFGKIIEGHSSGAKGSKLSAYIASGVSSCHEPIDADQVLERLRQGIYVMVREGSVRRDLIAISKIKDESIDLRRLILVTDGITPDELLEKGYLEYVVQKAINLGFNPVKAIQMATLNVAEHFSLDTIIGGIAPGKYADIVIIPNLNTIKAEYVIANGKLIARNGDLLTSPRKHIFSKSSLSSIHLSKKLTPNDFLIPIESGIAQAKVRIIDQITDLVTRELQLSVSILDGQVKSDVSADILKVAAIDRINKPGKMFTGLVKGFGMKNGAFASSATWDSSDILVVGVNEEDMARAVNRIMDLQGGVVVCANGEVRAELPLPVLGLISNQSIEFIVQKLEDIKEKLKELGCSLADPHLTLGILTCAAIPYFRICEEGLVNLKDGKTLNLFVS